MSSDLLIRKQVLLEKAIHLFDTTEEEIMTSRHVPYPSIRYAMFTVLYHDGFSVTDIGRVFNKDHATVSCGINSTHIACDCAGADSKLKQIYTSLSAGKKEPIIRTTTGAISKWLTNCSVDPDTKDKLISTISSLYYY